MGVLVFLLALTPGEKGGESGFTMHLLRAESPGPDVGKIAPKMKQTATILYWIYISLTAINFLFLIFDMPWFDALCTAFGTAGTGGFGIKNDSLASYSPYIQTVTGVFMLLFGVNFSCYYLILLKRFKNVFKDEELKLYVGIVVASVIAITVNLFSTWASLGTTLRHSFFQVSSIITTTGFSSCDFDVWPAFSTAILMLLMVVGACAGSTGGGFKCARVLLLFKNLRRNIQQMIHPNRVVAVRNNGKMIDEKIVANTNAYLAAYVIIIVFSILAISLDGYSVETNVSSVLACFNNIGPGFDAVGPIRNYADFSVFSKLVLIFNMLAGRLEIFPMLLLFSAGTWSRK
jgi:trk system potassium uptake protein TrkH